MISANPNTPPVSPRPIRHKAQPTPIGSRWVAGGQVAGRRKPLSAAIAASDPDHSTATST